MHRRNGKQRMVCFPSRLRVNYAKDSPTQPHTIPPDHQRTEEERAGQFMHRRKLSTTRAGASPVHGVNESKSLKKQHEAFDAENG